MKCYLDTNAVRQISKIKFFNEYSIFTSALSIFEIISGINTEKEYIKRKNILHAIEKSDLTILWELPRLTVIKSFNLPFNETDTEATKIMMNKIISSSDYNDMLKIRFNLGGEDYTIETFHSHDEDINKITFDTINNAIQNTTPIERKKLRDIDLDPSLIQLNKEILIRNFLMNNLNTNSVDNPYYLKAVETYFQNQQLDNFFILAILLPNKSLAEGLNAGSNDGMDYQHLVFTHNIDYFVSDDKFYKRIPNNINEYLDFNFISFSDFYSELNSKSNKTS